jgi:hypothetical protein
VLGALGHNASWWPMLPFLGLAAWLYRVGSREA